MNNDETLTAILTQRTLIIYGSKINPRQEYVPAGTEVIVDSEAFDRGSIDAKVRIKVPGYPGFWARVPMTRLDLNV